MDLQHHCDWVPGNLGSLDQGGVAGCQGDQGVGACLDHQVVAFVGFAATREEDIAQE